MKKHQIQITDWGLSREKIGKTLSEELNLNIFSFRNSIKKQFQIKDELTKRMHDFLNNGKLIPIELISELIQRNLKEVKEDLLFTDFPRTIEQLNELNKISDTEHFEIENIWYFKQKDPKQFLQDHLKSDKGKMWFNKYGEEVVGKWQTDYNKYKKYISEMQSDSNPNKWKVIQVEYETEFNEQIIKRKIKACA